MYFRTDIAQRITKETKQQARDLLGSLLTASDGMGRGRGEGKVITEESKVKVNPRGEASPREEATSLTSVGLGEQTEEFWHFRCCR